MLKLKIHCTEYFDTIMILLPFWTIVTNKLILIFLLRDGLKFFLTIISFTAMLHVVWVYFDTIMIILSCLNNLNRQTHLNFPSKRWLQVLFDNHIIHCHSILTPLWSFYLVWTIVTNKLILIFVLRDGLKFFLTIISFTAMLHVVWAYFDTIMILLFWLNNLNQQTHINFNSKWWLQVVLDNHFLAAEIHKLNLQFLSYRPVIYLKMTMRNVSIDIWKNLTHF